MIHIRTQFNQAKTQILTPELALNLLTNCRQELEETAQESVNRDYHQGKEALGKILTEEQEAALQKLPEQKAALEEAEGLYGQCLEQILWFSYPRGLCLCFRQFYRREAGAQPFRQEVEEAAYGTPPRNPWVSAAYRKAKERAGQLLETLAAQVGEADRTHVDAVTVAWEAWMRAFFRHACYLGYRSGLFCLEQASLDQGLPEMMEQVIRTEYALGITLPQCQQELHRELRMRHRKDPSPEPSTEDGERKRQGQTDSLTGLPHLVEGMPAEKQKTFRELVGEILELCNP